MTDEFGSPHKLHELRIAEERDREDLLELEDVPAGDYFSADLEEARALARHEPRFEALVKGLQADTIGERMAALTACFDQFSKAEIANLTLPPHLDQLRLIYLSSRPDDWP